MAAWMLQGTSELVAHVETRVGPLGFEGLSIRQGRSTELTEGSLSTGKNFPAAAGARPAGSIPHVIPAVSA
jgi:hypothetical protein